MATTLRENLTNTELFSCRICGQDTFQALNLGHHPFANALIDDPHQVIKTYPLSVRICHSCSAAQLSYCANDKELYEHYLYFTPQSSLLSSHYQNLLQFLLSNGYLGDHSNVLEIGSNIGRFLEYLKPHVGSVIGVDPAANVCAVANANGIPTVADFFNADTARRLLEESGRRDVLIARHCFAHNEKPWLMLEGVREIMAEDGVFLIENAYFYDTVQSCEFDQFYHEHMYYYGLRSMGALLQRYGFKLVDVFHSSIHGGAMMFVARLQESEVQPSAEVLAFLEKEKDMHRPEYYVDFVNHIQQNRAELTDLLRSLKAQGKTVHAYGASAKSTTLLNYYHISSELVPCVVDSTPAKQGKYIPFANIRVISEQEAVQVPPDYYLLTVWNYKEEIIAKARDWGNHTSRFILPHPHVEVID